jgi:hypothetical protein
MEVSGHLHAPAALPPGKNPQYPLDRRLGGSRASIDEVAKRKIPSPCRESNPNRPGRSQTSALDTGEVSALRSGCFTVGERAPGTHWIEEAGWATRAGLDAVARKENIPPAPWWQLNLGCPPRNPNWLSYASSLSKIILDEKIHRSSTSFLYFTEWITVTLNIWF